MTRRIEWRHALITSSSRDFARAATELLTHEPGPAPLDRRERRRLARTVRRLR